MLIEQRAYQTRDMTRIHDAMRDGHKGILYVLPTGGGKTVVAAMISQVAVMDSKKILFLVHRRELLDQTEGTLSDALPNHTVGVIGGGRSKDTDADILVTSVFALRDKAIPEPDIIFIDEAHHVRAASWERLLERWPDAQKIGLTATPARLDGKGLHEHFDKMIDRKPRPLGRGAVTNSKQVTQG